MNMEKLTAPLWGAIGGAVVLAIVGFTWGGWVTPGKAAHMTEQAVDKAVVDRLTLICVDKYNQDLGKVAKHEALMESKSWERKAYVESQGWSLIAGEKEADSGVSRSCAEALSEMKG
jgi:hypothetical protein